MAALKTLLAWQAGDGQSLMVVFATFLISCILFLVGGVAFGFRILGGREIVLAALILHFLVVAAWEIIWVWSRASIQSAVRSWVFVGPVFVGMVTIFGIWLLTRRDVVAWSKSA